MEALPLLLLLFSMVFLLVSIIKYRHRGHPVPPRITESTESTGQGRIPPCIFYEASSLRSFLRSSQVKPYFDTISSGIWRRKTQGGSHLEDYARLIRPLSDPERQWIQQCLSSIPPTPLINQHIRWKFTYVGNNVFYRRVGGGGVRRYVPIPEIPKK